MEKNGNIYRQEIEYGIVLKTTLFGVCFFTQLSQEKQSKERI
ncbi:unnamed protein product [Brassica oleracea]